MASDLAATAAERARTTAGDPGDGSGTATVPARARRLGDAKPFAAAASRRGSRVSAAVAGRVARTFPTDLRNGEPPCASPVETPGDTGTPLCSLSVATARDTEVVFAAGGASARRASTSSAAMSSASANSPRARRYAASMAPSVDIVGENAASPRAGTRYREGAAAVAGRSATKRASTTRLLSENDDGFVVASRVSSPSAVWRPTRDEGSCVPNPTRVGVDAADRSRSRDDGRADAARSADAVRPAVVPAVDCRVPRWVVASRVEPIEPSSRSDRETGVAAEYVRAPAKSPRRAELARKEEVVAAAAGGLVPPRALARSLAEAIASKLNWNSRCVRCDGPVATARTPTPAYALGAAAPARPEVGRRDLGRPSMDPRALEPRRGVSNDIGARRSERVSEEAFWMRRRSRTFLRWHTCVSKQS